MRIGLLMGACAGLLVVGCGGAQPKPNEPQGNETQTAAETAAPADQTTPTAEEPAAEATKKFDDMTKGEQVKYMKDVVLPQMKTLFAGFDSAEYGDFTCATCHGPEAKQGKFDMPSASLTKLTTTGKFEKEFELHPAQTKFMMEKVVPEMAKLLGEEPYNPETQSGFGCFDCHTAAQ